MEATKKDQALLMGIRKKDMTNNITITMTFMMIEPLYWSPSGCETDFQLSAVAMFTNSAAVIINLAAVITNSPAVITKSAAVITNSPAVTFNKKICTQRG